jgi:glycosyltransferase involved in cell wall biosynthesis
MKILSIGKEKEAGKLSIFVEREIHSLQGVDSSLHIDRFNLKGKGFIGYFRSFRSLKCKIKLLQPDIIHAHYSFSGVIAILASRKQNVIVSFMGSDVYFNGILFKVARWYILKKANHIIVKSNRLKDKLPHQKNITVIPNGVNMDLFQPMEKGESRKKLSWDKTKIHILFPAGKNRFEKNFPLAQEALKRVENKYNIKLHLLENIASDEVPVYLNAADFVLLTSRWEGSSNVIKEAMCCNTPVVSTDAGDVRELFEGLEGYFITNHTAEDIVSKIEEAIQFVKEKKETKGRERILELGLDDGSVAGKIIEVYKKVIEK